MGCSAPFFTSCYSGEVQDVLEHVADGVVVAAGDGRIEYLNPAAERLLGRSAARVVGSRLEEAFGAEPELAKMAARAGETKSEVARDGLRLGSTPVDAVAAPRLPDGVVLTIRDRTVAQQLAADARRADRLGSLSTIAAGIAHEVKNPLGGIRGAAQLMTRGAADPHQKEYLELIVREVDRIATLVDRLRDLAAPEKSRRDPVDLNRLLYEMAKLHSTAGEQRVDVQLDLDPSLPELAGDREALSRLFLNLLRNAMDAAKAKAKITTRVDTGRRWRDPEGAVHALVRVTFDDDGAGIAPADRDRLFEPFFTTKASGTGLGLAVAQRITHDHDGTIDCEVSPMGGARFVVVLPARTPGR